MGGLPRRPDTPPGLANRNQNAPGLQRDPGLSDNRGQDRAADARSGQVTRALPGRPSALRIQQASETSVRVSWAAVTPQADSITVSWWPRTSGGTAQSVTLAGGATSHIIERLQVAVMYEVLITASATIDAQSVSAAPTTGSFLIPPAPRAPVTPPGQGNAPGNPGPSSAPTEPGAEEQPPTNGDQPPPGRPVIRP